MVCKNLIKLKPDKGYGGFLETHKNTELHTKSCTVWSNLLIVSAAKNNIKISMRDFSIANLFINNIIHITSQNI